ncbi:hypothetical protein RvY_15781 [Ramazzottius varieornatus]|uniref:Transmembrane protein 254 n=1 Tax=Ramazzottius varieornatus TaxID=947166 RepID=A0A1D1W0Q3_RAMVA|nr:hypothetical protein RvY_15781 [Ramazzottius varieornatus]
MAPVTLPVKKTFFQVTELKWMFLISAGLGMLVWSWLSPLTIPGPGGWYLGPLGALGQYLGVYYPAVVRAIVYLTSLVHVGEALFAVKLCRDSNLTRTTALKWFVQTLCFGIASLGILWTRTKAAKRF